MQDHMVDALVMQTVIAAHHSAGQSQSCVAGNSCSVMARSAE